MPCIAWVDGCAKETADLLGGGGHDVLHHLSAQQAACKANVDGRLLRRASNR